MNAKDAMIEEARKIELLEEVLEKQDALIREYRSYISILADIPDHKRSDDADAHLQNQ